MSAYDYSVPAATALRMLTKYGQTVTRRTYTEGTYSTTTGTVTSTTADTSRIGAIFDIKPGTTQIRGALVQVGDKELFLDAEGSAAVTDHYVIGSVEYAVMSVDTLAPAGTTALHTLHLRVA